MYNVSPDHNNLKSDFPDNQSRLMPKHFRLNVILSIILSLAFGFLAGYFYHANQVNEVIIIPAAEFKTEAVSGDIIKDRWYEIKEKVTATWDKLTVDDVDKMKGSYEELAALLQEKYGYAKEQSKTAIDEFLEKHNWKKR